MRNKIVLLTSAVLMVLSVGCARQRTITPPQITPQSNTLNVPRGTVVSPQTVTPDRRMNDGKISGVADGRTDTGTGTQAGTGAVPGTAVGEGTGVSQGSGLGMGAGTGTSQGSIEHGTYNGDLYISSNNFRLIDTTVNGDVYFTTTKAKSTFKMDAKSKITGSKKMVD